MISIFVMPGLVPGIHVLAAREDVDGRDKPGDDGRKCKRRNKEGAHLVKNTPFDLTGKVAVITGSSRGIGRSSAELLAKLGAKVVISSRKADACQEVAEGIKKSLPAISRAARKSKRWSRARQSITARSTSSSATPR
jgi:NADPH:quinone reductase-like Zn-dependent oxidoreductase